MPLSRSYAYRAVMAALIETAKTQRQPHPARDPLRASPWRHGRGRGSDATRAVRGAVGAGDPAALSQLAGVVMGKEITADDFPVRTHVEADGLPQGEK